MSTSFFVPDDWRNLFLNETKIRLPNSTLTELEPGFFQSSRNVTLQISSCLLQGADFEVMEMESIQKGAERVIGYFQMPRLHLEEGWNFVLGVHPFSLRTPRQSQRTRLLQASLEQKLKKFFPHLQRHRRQARPMTTIWAVLLPSGKLAITHSRKALTTETSTGALLESWPLPAGRADLVKTEAPPSRAYLKLKEGFGRFDFLPEPSMQAVDLGASPGGWSYEIAQYGSRLLSIDRAPLDPRMAEFKNVEFRKGDARTFRPKRPVDLMVCDVIAYPQQNFELLVAWLKEKLCTYFFVTLKFKREPDWKWIDQAQLILRPLCEELMMRRLESNKNEIMVMGKSSR